MYYYYKIVHVGKPLSYLQYEKKSLVAVKKAIDPKRLLLYCVFEDLGSLKMMQSDLIKSKNDTQIIEITKEEYDSISYS